MNKWKMKVIQLNHQKMLWHLQKHKSMQTKELDLLKEHNATMILKLEKSAGELKEKFKNWNS